MDFDPWQMLCARYHQGTLPHASLLIGNQDMSTQGFARRFAEYVLTEGLDSHAGHALLKAGSHPDFKHLAMTETIKIDDIRELIPFVNTTPQLGRYKVILIEGAERMNIASSNALLKTLEEPPGQMLILLTTHQPDMLLPTIRSRCQMIRLPLLSAESLSPELLRQRQEITDDVRAILSKKGDVIKIAERWAKLEQTFLLDYLTESVMDLIRQSEVKNKKQTKQFFVYLDRLYEARRCLFARLNPNAQLLLETLFV